MPGKAWEACAGRSAILPTTTTASIVSVILFPCVVVLIITPTDPGWGKNQKKGPHWKKEWGKWMIEFFLYPPVPLFLSTNSVLVGSDVSFRARRVFFLCVCVKYFVALSLWEPFALFKNADRCCDTGRCAVNTSEKNPFERYLEMKQGPVCWSLRWP